MAAEILDLVALSMIPILRAMRFESIVVTLAILTTEAVVNPVFAKGNSISSDHEVFAAEVIMATQTRSCL